jgi:glucokinase
VKLVLAGDVGGTKSNLAIYDWHLAPGPGIPSGAPLVPPPPVAMATYASQDPRGLAFIAADFCQKHSLRPDVACFGIAGPVVDGRVKAPNLPWEVDAREIGGILRIGAVTLLNDLEAAAYGVCCVGADRLVTLQAGTPRDHGNICVIAAGTGLGEASLVTIGGRRHALASEGGHCDFAPADDLQNGLLQFIRETNDHVSWERILSGPGIARIYEYLCRCAGRPAAAKGSAGDAAAGVSAAALDGTDPRAVEALRLFSAIYGAEAGNMALRLLCFGGLFVAGGIAPKILPFLTGGRFMKSFLAKGRMARLMPEFPVHVVTEQLAPLLGAAAVGATLPAAHRTRS